MKTKTSFIIAFAFLISLISTIHGYAQTDTTAPQLQSFAFSPSAVNTSDSPQTITVTGRATDDLSGVPNSITVIFVSPSGLQQAGTAVFRQSGTALDSIYRDTITLGRYAEPGIYQVRVEILDRVLNRRTYNQSDLAVLGFPTALEVISSTPDTTAPQLQSFAFSPGAVNTTGSPQTITVTARATDDLSGAQNSISVGFVSPSGVPWGTAVGRLSGTALDGVYRDTITLPRFTEPGIYQAYVETLDRVLNRRTYNQSDLAALGFPTALYVNLPPPAVSAVISGKVLDQRGRGVFGAMVTSTDSNGGLRHAMTNPFGRYRFDNLTMSDTHTLRVRHKRLTFAPQTLAITAQSHNLDFIAN